MAMALVGEVLDPDDEVCGLVASTRPKIDRIQVWTRGRDDVDRINGLGRRILEAVNLEGRDVESMSMEFQVSHHDVSRAEKTVQCVGFQPSGESIYPHPLPSSSGVLLARPADSLSSQRRDTRSIHLTDA